MICSRSYLRSHGGAFFASLVVIVMAAAPRGAWAQSSWPNYPNNSTITVSSSGNVGIGTVNPGANLDIESSTSPVAYLFNGSTGPGTDQLQFDTHTGAFAMIFLNNDLNTGGIGGASALTLVNESGSSGPLVLGANGTEAMRITGAGKVGIGTTNPQHTLQVAGTIGAQEVLVTSTGADYVFDPGYRLKPLNEVAAYIEANHHLPDIPSAEEVKEKGMGVGEMEAKLLAKVEELTLHRFPGLSAFNRMVF